MTPVYLWLWCCIALFALVGVWWTTDEYRTRRCHRRWLEQIDRITSQHFDQREHPDVVGNRRKAS